MDRRCRASSVDCRLLEGMSATAAAAGRHERAESLAPEPQQDAAQLRAAALSGDVALAQWQLSTPCDESWPLAEASDTYGENSLHLAARNGHAAVLALMSGVDVNRRSKAGATPLWLACFHGHKQVAQLLLERGAQPERLHGLTGSAPLAASAAQGHLPLVQLLVLESNAEIDRPNRNGRTALWSAAFEGHASVVQFLLDRGAAPAPKSKAGWTPFSAALLTRDAPPEEHEYENSPRPHSPTRRVRYDEVVEILTKVTQLEDREAPAREKVFMGCVEAGGRR